jgi:hypothetical protein
VRCASGHGEGPAAGLVEVMRFPPWSVATHREADGQKMADMP